MVYNRNEGLDTVSKLYYDIPSQDNRNKYYEKNCQRGKPLRINQCNTIPQEQMKEK